MKKILLVFDGSHFSEGAFRFANLMNAGQQILVTGVFVPQVEYASLWSYSGGGISSPIYIPMMESDDAVLVDENIARFETICIKNNIEFRVHKAFKGFSPTELKKETRFADLLILGSESFYKNLGTGELNDFLVETLHDVECPVVVVPENYDFPQNNILTYDGSASSVYAIKQFAYLFPELAKNHSLLVYAGEETDTIIPEEIRMEELTARHFPDLTISRIPIQPGNPFANWVSDSKASIVVSGAFGRSSFSRMFRKSFIDEVIKEHRLPVFITHR